MKSILVALSATITICSAQIYQESGGLVVMEMENTESPFAFWQKKTSLAGYSGSGYLEFGGNDFDLGKPKSPLAFHFKINRGGVYVLDLHCARTAVEGHPDWANDCYVRVVGDFASAPGPHDIPRGHASLNLLKTDTKFFGGAVDEWQWAAGDWPVSGGRLDPGGKNNKRKAVYHFKSGKSYTLVVSGRSKGFRLDRIVFRRNSVAVATAHDLGRPESETTSGAPPIPDDLDTTFRAADFDGESHPGDADIIRKTDRCVASIDDGSWIRFDNFDFGVGAGASIDIQAASDTAGGVIEVRADSATGTLLGSVSINKTWRSTHYEYSSANLVGVRGSKALYFVFKGSGSDLFNFKDFVICSGVTVDEKLASPPVRPPVGRVAYLADGNSPDPDDIGGTAAALALLRAAGLADRLVYGAHSCDLVKASNISAAAELDRQRLMQTSCDGTASRWGGFDGVTFWNCRTHQIQAINELTAHINASSSSDPLWILEAGEPDIIGYALKAAAPSKRKHVKVLTHHPVNDGSGDYFKWNQILQLGVNEVRIPDQNGTKLGKGLQRPLWAFHWARDHEDSRIRWLWDQGKIAEEDGVVSFQDGKFDISDAGLMFYWITGGDVNGGYRAPTVHDIRKLLERKTEGSTVR